MNQFAVTKARKIKQQYFLILMSCSDVECVYDFSVQRFIQLTPDIIRVILLRSTNWLQDLWLLVVFVLFLLMFFFFFADLQITDSQ